MLDTENNKCWLNGKLLTESGDVIHFEFSIDKKHPGGVIRLVEPDKIPESTVVNPVAMRTASGVFGVKMRELLINGNSLFSGVRMHSESSDLDEGR